MANKIPQDPRKKNLTREEEYFGEQEQKKRAALREKLDREREEARKKQEQATHWLKCPKCGGELEEKKFEDVVIDRCKSCSGVWLDAGELELLLHEHQGIVKSVAESLRRMLK
jgi:uncharacterized protein